MWTGHAVPDHRGWLLFFLVFGLLLGGFDDLGHLGYLATY
jgi:hypothetical protein